VKKKKNKIKKYELQSKIKIKILAKKPQKGGTPAIDKIVISKIFVKILVDPKSLKENKVFVLKFVNWNKVQNKINKDKL
jgi:hypothetical protein